MNGIGCAATREVAPELALGILDGAARAEALLHLASCPRCQRYVSELAGVADGLSRLAPEMEPPAGFAQRIDAEIRRPRRRFRRRFVGAIAVAAAAATIISVATVQIVDAGRPAATVAAPALHSAEMVGANGARVGHVAVSSTNPSSLVVNVDYAVPDGHYTLELSGPDASGHRIGAMSIAEGRGEWIGTAALPSGADVNLMLVNAQGVAVCQAAVTQAQAS
jgi:hypothetical protein